MNFKDLKHILFTTIKQLSKLDRFNLNYLKKHKKTVFDTYDKIEYDDLLVSKEKN